MYVQNLFCVCFIKIIVWSNFFCMSLRISMLGHKRIPSREGGIEIVVEELSTRMAKFGHNVTFEIQLIKNFL